MDSYSKDLYPREDRPTEDRLGVYINRISINEKDMTFEITFYMKQSWQDPRLSWERSTVDSWDDIPDSLKRKLQDGFYRKIRVSPENVNKLFLPDLFFR